MHSLKDIISVLKDKNNAKYASKIEIQFSGLPKKNFVDDMAIRKQIILQYCPRKI